MKGRGAPNPKPESKSRPKAGGADLGLRVTKYRLLGPDEVMRVGDQYLTDDAETWDEVKGWPIGMKWRPYSFQPVRRAL